jgi:exopolyphosphatase/guanosine-5'-triphosphate,3'-diphosphate pyrophosphatase
MRAASVDLGTNTFRLLIAEWDGYSERIHILHEERKIVRMGEGLAVLGKMAPQAQKRALKALHQFREVLEALKVGRVRAVATSVFREAGNAKPFLLQASNTLGFPIEIISGEEEARLTLKGALMGLRLSKGILFDIGGGSTEYVRFQSQTPIRLLSTTLGVVKLAETFLCHDPPTQREMQDLWTYVRRATEKTKEQLGEEAWPLIGTAGTVTTLAAIDMGLSVYQHDKVHGYLLDKKKIEHMLSLFLSRTKHERLGILGLEEGREDLIIPGTVITLVTMESWDQEILTVSDLGLREGVLLDGFREY